MPPPHVATDLTRLRLVVDSSSHVHFVTSLGVIGSVYVRLIAAFYLRDLLPASVERTGTELSLYLKLVQGVGSLRPMVVAGLVVTLEVGRVTASGSLKHRVSVYADLTNFNPLGRRIAAILIQLDPKLASPLIRGIRTVARVLVPVLLVAHVLTVDTRPWSVLVAVLLVPVCSVETGLIELSNLVLASHSDKSTGLEVLVLVLSWRDDVAIVAIRHVSVVLEVVDLAKALVRPVLRVHVVIVAEVFLLDESIGLVLQLSGPRDLIRHDIVIAMRELIHKLVSVFNAPLDLGTVLWRSLVCNRLLNGALDRRVALVPEVRRGIVLYPHGRELGHALPPRLGGGEVAYDAGWRLEGGGNGILSVT